MKPTGCLPANEVLNPRTMKDQIKLYRDNHGFSVEKFWEYITEYDQKVKEVDELVNSIPYEKMDSESWSNEDSASFFRVKAEILFRLSDMESSPQTENIKEWLDECLGKLKKSKPEPEPNMQAPPKTKQISTKPNIFRRALLRLSQLLGQIID